MEKIKFTSPDKRINDFLRMAELLGFLESSASKAEKIREISKAKSEGLIDDEKAIDLATEFC